MILPDRRNPDWWIPWCFVAFFAVMFIANGTMVYFAVTTFTGVETNSAYRDGLSYNKKLEAQAIQRALGWQTALAFEHGRDQSGSLQLTLSDRDGGAINGADVVVHFVRPTHAGSDFQDRLDPRGSGRYATEVAFPLPGLWDVEMTIQHPRGQHRFKERVFIKP